MHGFDKYPLFLLVYAWGKAMVLNLGLFFTNLTSITQGKIVCTYMHPPLTKNATNQKWQLCPIDTMCHKDDKDIVACQRGGVSNELPGQRLTSTKTG